MSIALALCQAQPDAAKQIAAIDAQMDVVEASVNAAIDTLLGPDAASMAAQIQTVIDQQNTAFIDSVPGSLDASFVNAGVTPIKRSKRDAEKILERNGFIAVNGKAYSLGSGFQAPAATPTNLRVGDGLADKEALSALLGFSYSDPNLSVPSASRSITLRNDQQRSSTGTYLQGGSLDELRELAHAFAGDLKMLRRFLDDSWAQGFGIVWSIPYYRIVEKADTDPAALTNDWVREKLNFPAYDEEISLFPKYNRAVVMSELYVRDNCNRITAEAVARDLASSTGIDGTPALFCRVVRFDSAEDVRQQTPTLRTSGFDGTKLGRTCYKLGITVCGLSRVVDVTGDLGSRQIYSKYTAESVAASISRIFGVYLNVSAYGNELNFATSDKGAAASIGFFPVGDGDCSDAIGINGAISYSAANQNRVGGSASKQDLTLDSTGSVSWNGGSVSSDLATSTFTSMVLSYGLSEAQVNALLGGSDYWAQIESSVAPVIDSINTECSVEESTRTWLANMVSNVRSLERQFGFVDLVDLRYRDSIALFDELGLEGMADVLFRRPLVNDIDLYVSQASVRSTLFGLVQNHIDAGAAESTPVSVETIHPFRQNRGKIAKFASLFEYLLAESSLLSYDESSELRDFLCSYAPSLLVSSSAIVGTNGSEPFDLVSSIGDAISSLLTTISDPNCVQDALAAAISAICSLDRDVCNKIQEYWASAENGVNSAVDWVSNGINSIVGPVYSHILTALVALNKLLERAQRIVMAGRRAITTMFQKTFHTKKTLPEILEDLSNIQYNVYGNLSFQTKFVSCYASGSGSVMLSALWSKMMDILNGLINALNSMIDRMLKSLNDALDVISCLVDKLMSGLSGFAEYTMSGGANYLAGGLIPIPIAFSLQCTVNFGFSTVDPGIAREIAKIKENLNLLAALLRISTLKYNKLDDSVKIYKALEISQSTASSTIIEMIRKQIQDKLNSLLSC
jgi:hypothetical protein